MRGSIHIEHTLARIGAERLWNLLGSQPFVGTASTVALEGSTEQLQFSQGNTAKPRVGAAAG